MQSAPRDRDRRDEPRRQQRRAVRRFRREAGATSARGPGENTAPRRNGTGHRTWPCPTRKLQIACAQQVTIGASEHLMLYGGSGDGMLGMQDDPQALRQRQLFQHEQRGRTVRPAIAGCSPHECAGPRATPTWTSPSSSVSIRAPRRAKRHCESDASEWRSSAITSGRAGLPCVRRPRLRKGRREGRAADEVAPIDHCPVTLFFPWVAASPGARRGVKQGAQRPCRS